MTLHVYDMTSDDTRQPVRDVDALGECARLYATQTLGRDALPIAASDPDINDNRIVLMREAGDGEFALVLDAFGVVFDECDASDFYRNAPRSTMIAQRPRRDDGGIDTLDKC